jgi:long-subunit fatty acid transport protein
MKLSLLFVITLLFVSITVNAQQEYFEYGFKGGLNLSNITGDGEEVSGYDTRTSMNIGMYGLYKILPKLGLQAELLYSEQGFSERFDSEIINIDEIKSLTRMQYINVPVIVSYNLIEQLWIEGGVQVGYLVNAEEEREERFINDSNQLISETETIDQTSTYESLELGLLGGLRYKLSQNFMIQARYQKSINDIDKDLVGDQFNEVWSFSVGFVF